MFHGSCSGTSKQSEVEVFAFSYKGRTVPFRCQKDSLSAFATTNLINVTASTGSSLESLTQLVQLTHDLDHMETIADLTNDSPRSESVQAEHGTYQVTNWDRLQLSLAKLPKIFHDLVDEAYGGPNLCELCTKDIALQMVEGKIPLTELRLVGYPEDVIEAVKATMHRAIA